MNEWFTEFVQTNLAAQQPPPPPIPQLVPVSPQGLEPLRLSRPLGHGVSVVEYSSISGAERKGHLGIISSLFIDNKCKEFLKLNQGRMFVTKYEREFVRLSKYARECVSTKAIICKRFEDGLNRDIGLLVGI
ncbi:Retrotransposon gag domain-containing 1 [Gossypium australe]|uniref:Retrotransposon gag domain-containing 1 n=1 Tax=Gossypium australe TaxID=47621 RepID=A0A5B6VXL2_9ROSI|nr:Retrotransposon gag domain-containing 1 [Gossypium australe]